MEESKSLPIKIQPKIVFGLRQDVIGNIHFTLNDEVIYPVAGVLAVHNYKTSKQKFLRLPEKVEICHVIISPNRKSLGIAEKLRNETKSVNTIQTYDIETFKRKRTIHFPNDIPTKEVAAMSFTNDSKGMAVLTKEPDAYLILFFFDKNQTVVMGRVSHSTHQLCVARHISCSLIDSGLVAIGGTFTFKLLNKTEKGFAPMGTIKGDGIVITSLAWLTNDILIAGTNETELFIVDNGDLKLIYNALDVTLIDLSQIADSDDGDENKKDMQTLLMTRRKSNSLESNKKGDIDCLTRFEKGFCFANHNTIHVFAKESNNMFKKATVITIPITLYSPELYRIKTVAIDSHEKTIMVTALHSQIYTSNLFVPESVSVKQLQFITLGQPLHIAGIIGLSVCAWKPTVITAAKDQTVRIWNYKTGEIELVKKYLVDISVIALHPSGIFVAVGFSDQLRLMEILLDDLKVLKGYNFPKCQEAVFSHKGHLLAVAYDNMIAIVSVFTFDVLRILKGHNGEVLSLAWCFDDLHLVSAGIEGGVYEWNVMTGVRTNEVVQKGLEYRGITVTNDSDSIYAITNSGVLREICKSEILRETKIPDQPPLTCITLARSDLIMFISSELGHLYNVQLPFMETGGGTCTNYRFFNEPIRKMRITYDDCFLATASNDGTLVIWNILNNENRKGHVDKRLGICADVLIPRQDLLNKMESIENLEMRINQQLVEFEYQLCQKDTNYEKQIANIHHNYSEAIEELKKKNDELEAQHVEELNLITAHNAELQDQHQKTILDLETEFHKKIIVEYDRSQAMSDKLSKLKDDCEVRLRKSAGYLEDTIESMESDFKKQLEKRREVIKTMVEKYENRNKEFIEYCRQEKLDFDQQLVKLRLNYEKKLKHEQEVNSKWRCEAGILSKKFNMITKSNAKLKEEIEEVQNEYEHLKRTIHDQKVEIESLHCHIKTIEHSLKDRDKTIIELNKSKENLETVQITLNGRFEDLRKRMEPKEKENIERKAQIMDMEFELETLQNKNAQLDLNLQETREKHIAVKTELKTKITAAQDIKTQLSRIIADIHLCYENIQSPVNLQAFVKMLYSKYGKFELDSDISIENKLKEEFQRQRDHMHTNSQTSQANQSGKTDIINNQLIEENITLLSDIAELQLQVQKSESRIKSLEKLLGPALINLSPKEAKARLDRALKNIATVEEEYNLKIKSLEMIIKELKNDDKK